MYSIDMISAVISTPFLVCAAYNTVEMTISKRWIEALMSGAVVLVLGVGISVALW